MLQGGKAARNTRLTAPRQLLQQALSPLERQVDEGIVQRSTSIEFPMEHIEAVDSHALNWLLVTDARLKNLGIAFQLTHPSAVVIDILTATRLDARLTVANDDFPVVVGGAV